MKRGWWWNRKKPRKESDEYLRSIYYAAQKVHMTDWVASLLEEYGYPPQTPEMLDRITEMYIHRMENGTELGTLEHYTFENTMDYDFPEIKPTYEEDEE